MNLIFQERRLSGLIRIIYKDSYRYSISTAKSIWRARNLPMSSRAKLNRERGPKRIKDQHSVAQGEKEAPGAEIMRRRSINKSVNLRRKKRSFQMVLIYDLRRL